jgi:hypothetical protein
MRRRNCTKIPIITRKIKRKTSRITSIIRRRKIRKWNNNLERRIKQINRTGRYGKGRKDKE